VDAGRGQREDIYWNSLGKRYKINRKIKGGKCVTGMDKTRKSKGK
jgi:hypothetical protein